eukprot:TRINITY_DN9485_c0_g1_i1.p1 TRINITY_DN9485_c0_g1~~TRINITY_DN9485_c0_g1_i1.p1  ORF type:complete len:491 (-),score=100.33 TRINITY_DN9485_c0_g1_i1:529-2001(-)
MIDHTNMEESPINRKPSKVMEKEEPEYMLRWSEHNPQVVGSFHQLWENNHLTDVTLATETRSFQAHRLLLSACSPYFRNLFIMNPCKHPTVFLKDIPERHMELLLEYMYQGCIAVKQHELAEILSTASSLKIRGLTTAEAPPLAEDQDLLQPLVVDDQYNGSEAAMDKFHHLETESTYSTGSGSRKAEGRKSSKPKKLRLSGDTESDLTSPRYPVSLQEKEQRISPVERTSPNLSPSDDNIAVSDDEKELVIEEPVDFSTNNSEPGNVDSKYSILGSYLKSGRTSANPEEGNYKTVSGNEMSENLRRAGLGGGWMDSLNSMSRPGPRPASRDSRGYSKEDDTNEEDNNSEGKEYPQLSLTDTMGIDIAERLRTHFLANLPSQNYNWLNGSSPLMDQVKREKHPSGGIRTGEIGPNGKPSVKCEECGKQLADPSSLYRHRKIHTGDKPHKCPYCERRFIQRFNMKQHIKTHRIELMADQAQGITHGIPFQH